MVLLCVRVVGAMPDVFVDLMDDVTEKRDTVNLCVLTFEHGRPAIRRQRSPVLNTVQHGEDEAVNGQSGAGTRTQPGQQNMIFKVKLLG